MRQSFNPKRRPLVDFHGFRYMQQSEIDKRMLIHNAFDKVSRRYDSEALGLPLASDIEDFLGDKPRPITERDSNRLFQCIAPEGKPLAIRYEGTALVAKYVKAVMDADPTADKLRYHYFQEMLRIEQRSELDDKHSRSFYQAGAEFFTKSYTEHIIGMAELSRLVIEFFNELGLAAVLRFSHIDVIQKLLASVDSLSSTQRKKIRELLEKSTFENTQKYLRDVHMPQQQMQILMELKRLGVGTMDDTIAVLEQHPTFYQTAVEELKLFNTVLSQLGIAENCFFDAGIHRSLRFYSGIVFQGDIEGMPECLGGGDFSGLVESFGYKEKVYSSGMAVGVERVSKFVK